VLDVARQYVEANLAEATLAPAEICRALGVAICAVSRVRAVGRRRCLHPGAAPRAGARAAHFASAAHFSRAFRRAFGVAPSDVRGVSDRDVPPTREATAGPQYRAWVRGAN